MVRQDVRKWSILVKQQRKNMQDFLCDFNRKRALAAQQMSEIVLAIERLMGILAKIYDNFSMENNKNSQVKHEKKTKKRPKSLDTKSKLALNLERSKVLENQLISVLQEIRRDLPNVSEETLAPNANAKWVRPIKANSAPQTTSYICENPKRFKIQNTKSPAKLAKKSNGQKVSTVSKSTKSSQLKKSKPKNAIKALKKSRGLTKLNSFRKVSSLVIKDTKKSQSGFWNRMVYEKASPDVNTSQTLTNIESLKNLASKKNSKRSIHSPKSSLKLKPSLTSSQSFLKLAALLMKCRKKSMVGSKHPRRSLKSKPQPDFRKSSTMIKQRRSLQSGFRYQKPKGRGIKFNNNRKL